MNVGLEQAMSDVILFLDDDIIPHANLIAAHLSAHADGHNIVAGQVLQPGEKALSQSENSRAFRFASSKKQFITELMGGNFSIKRLLALGLGGFDENFVHVAYRFEAEFAQRALAALLNMLSRPWNAVRTRHHLMHPWWIPATLASEAMGFAWAVFLYLRGPRLLNSTLAVDHD